MKFTISTAAALSLAFSGLTSALMCIPTSLVGGETLLLKNDFVLYGRDINGDTLPIDASNTPIKGGFFYPLSLGKNSTKKGDLPYFQLQNSMVYAYGGEIFSTNSTPTLSPVPLYISADSSQKAERFFYVNATCDGTPQKLLRFAGVTPLPLASASVSGSFAKGAALMSPILDNLITLQTPIDLIITPLK